MATEVTILFRDDCEHVWNEEEHAWITEYLEQFCDRLTVMDIDTEEV